MSIRLVVFLVIVCLPSAVSAQWSIVSEHRDLRGKRVIDVGSLRLQTARVRRRDAAGLPTLSSDTSWIEFEGIERRCLDEHASIRVPLLSGVAALLLADERGMIYLATLGSDIDAVRVDVIVPHWVRCPSQSNSVGSPP